jgi:hypothetical protein
MAKPAELPYEPGRRVMVKPAAVSAAAVMAKPVAIQAQGEDPEPGLIRLLASNA